MEDAVQERDETPTAPLAGEAASEQADGATSEKTEETKPPADGD